MLKDEKNEKIVEVAREKGHVQQDLNKINSWLLIKNKTNGVQKAVGWYIQSAERKNCQPGILYPAKLFLKNEDEVKTLPVKQKTNRIYLLADFPCKKY